MALVDTHCHLDFDAFNNDRRDVIQRAQQAGLVRIVNPSIDIDNCQAVLRLCELNPMLSAAVGVHPNSALTWGTATINQLREFAQHPKVVAIGEIGLDYYRDSAPKEMQKEIFLEQLALADELGLPVIVHSRQAESITVEILTEWAAQLRFRPNPPGVLHSYGGDETTAQRAIHVDFYIGITGPVTFRNAANLQNIVKNLPLSHLLVETDAPFLAPHPHRGKRNEPAYVRLVADKIAELKNLPVERVYEVTTQNAEGLFHWRTV